jgi:hypothetical protein
MCTPTKINVLCHILKDIKVWRQKMNAERIGNHGYDIFNLTDFYALFLYLKRWWGIPFDWFDDSSGNYFQKLLVFFIKNCTAIFSKFLNPHFINLLDSPSLSKFNRLKARHFHVHQIFYTVRNNFRCGIGKGT